VGDHDARQRIQKGDRRSLERKNGHQERIEVALPPVKKNEGKRDDHRRDAQGNARKGQEEAPPRKFPPRDEKRRRQPDDNGNQRREESLEQRKTERARDP